jgi:hypothetical protein
MSKSGTKSKSTRKSTPANARLDRLFRQLEDEFQRPGYPIDAQRVFELMSEIHRRYGSDKSAIGRKDRLLVNRITELANDAAAVMDSLWAVWIDLVRCLVLTNITFWGLSEETSGPPLPQLPHPWPPPPKRRSEERKGRNSSRQREEARRRSPATV